MPQSEPSFDDLLSGCRQTADHLEMRDIYGMSDEVADFATWQQSGAVPHPTYLEGWFDQVGATRMRGVAVRRLRVVSLPPSDYIRFEHATTGHNVAAGEEVRWLSRRDAADLVLPGTDCWIFDGRAVWWNFFDGNGNYTGQGFTANPHVSDLYASAFEATWKRATPHAQFNL
jgi:hypothetical protein